MNEKALRILEYQKIISLLVDKASSVPGKELCSKLMPMTDLKKIEDSFAHVADEINDILKKSEENAQLVGDKILEDAQKNVSNIKENTQKSVENKSQLIKNDILTRASEASIEVAKNHIVNELRNNPSLHDKLINDSINALDGVNLRAGL